MLGELLLSSGPACFREKCVHTWGLNFSSFIQHLHLKTASESRLEEMDYAGWKKYLSVSYMLRKLNTREFLHFPFDIVKIVVHENQSSAEILCDSHSPLIHVFNVRIRQHKVPLFLPSCGLYFISRLHLCAFDVSQTFSFMSEFEKKNYFQND